MRSFGGVSFWPILVISLLVASFVIFFKWPVQLQTGKIFQHLMSPRKLHSSYVHYLDTTDTNTVENFKFFVHFGYEPCHPDMYYTFLLNAADTKKTNLTDQLTNLLGRDTYKKMIDCAVNTRIVLRPNTPGADLCAHVENFQTDEWKAMESKFSFFFFINSSVRGPFLPVYYLKAWWDIFVDMFDKYPQVAAIGPNLSCEINPHIQSFMVAVDTRGFSSLKEVWRCTKPDESRLLWVHDTEVRLGTVLIQKGYQIRSLIKKYEKINIVDTSNPACEGYNPSFRYPLNSQEKQAIFNTSSPPDVAVNIHETTWLKYGGRAPIHIYYKDYITLYTKLAYQNKQIK